MQLLAPLRSFWRSIRHRSDVERLMAEELQFHLVSRAEHLADSRGLSPEDAMRLARLEFGPVERFKEEARESLGLRLLDELRADLRYTVRTFARSKGFTATAVVTLALGIGINCAAFTLLNAVILKAPPFPDAQELVHVGMTDGSVRWDMARMSYPEFLEARSRARSLKALAAFAQSVPVDISDPGNLPERYRSAAVTANLFAFMGLRPLHGRDFTEEDERVGAPAVVIIGHAVWRDRYGSADDVVGRTIRVNGTPSTIIGVMPEGIRFPVNESLWMPLVPGPNHQQRDRRDLDVFGRLAPGISLDQTRAELGVIGQQLSERHPDTNKNVRPVAGTYQQWSNGPEIETLFLTMFGAVGLVLLVACANVANLMLSRMSQRTREVSIRGALGAGRGRVIRQLLVESVTMSMMGGALGFVVAAAGVRLFDVASAGIEGRPYWADFGMDYRVFTYFLLISIATGILFGVLPAVRAAGLNVNEYLKEGGRGVAGSASGRRLTTGLVVAEISLTVVLLAGAGLFARSFLKMQPHVRIDTEDLYAARVELPANRYSTSEDLVTFQERLLERLNGGVGRPAVTIASEPFVGGAEMMRLQVQDLVAFGEDAPRDVPVLSIADGYFRTLAMKVVQGREFEAGDGRSGFEAAIVDQAFAARYWPHDNPLGKRIRLGESPWLTIVGISEPVLDGAAAGRNTFNAPVAYVPFRLKPVPSLALLIRAPSTDAPFAALRADVSSLDPDLPVIAIASFNEILREMTWATRVFGSVFAVFAIVALVMSSVGIFGVTAFVVSQRVHELGVRMALGATRRRILWLVLRPGVMHTAAGLAIGLVGAFLVTGVMKGLLFDVEPTDPVTFATVSMLLSAVALIAALVPASRAMHLAPIDALRKE